MLNFASSTEDEPKWLSSYTWRTMIAMILEINICAALMLLIVTILMTVYKKFGGIGIKHAESNESLSQVSLSQKPDKIALSIITLCPQELAEMNSEPNQSITRRCSRTSRVLPRRCDDKSPIRSMPKWRYELAVPGDGYYPLKKPPLWKI